jgi:hypothetical protein
MSLILLIRYRGGLAIAADRLARDKKSGQILPPHKKLHQWGRHAIVSTTNCTSLSMTYPAGPWKHPAGFTTNLPQPITAGVDFDRLTKEYIARTPAQMPFAIFSLAEEQRRAFHAAFDPLERRLWPPGLGEGYFVGALGAYYSPESGTFSSEHARLHYTYTAAPAIRHEEILVSNQVFGYGHAMEVLMTDPMFADLRAEPDFANFLLPHEEENDRNEVVAFLRRLMKELSRFRSPIKGLQVVSAECDIALITADGVTWASPEEEAPYSHLPPSFSYVVQTTVNADGGIDYNVATVPFPTYAGINLPPQTTTPTGGPYITNYLGDLVFVFGGSRKTIPTTPPGGYPAGTYGQVTINTLGLVITGLVVCSIANGGTNSGAALANHQVMISQGDAIIEGGAMTNGQLMIGSTLGSPAPANITSSDSSITVINGPNTIDLKVASGGGGGGGAGWQWLGPFAVDFTDFTGAGGTQFDKLIFTSSADGIIMAYAYSTTQSWTISTGTITAFQLNDGVTSPTHTIDNLPQTNTSSKTAKILSASLEFNANIGGVIKAFASVATSSGLANLTAGHTKVWLAVTALP